MNKNLILAKVNKNDEFFTLYEDVEAELSKYDLQGKVIYLPCDNPQSAFWQYFINNFSSIGIKKVIATSLDRQKFIYDGTLTIQDIESGDFRKRDEIDECDVVITNPPFSQFRDFINWILKHNKQFLVIGSQNAFSYREVFYPIKNNQIWCGYNKVHKFTQPDGTIRKFGNICWFTNLPKKENEKLTLTKEYDEALYPKFDNLDAINVDRVCDIPKDYFEPMGVPITFIDKYNPEQFEILGISKTWDGNNEHPLIDGKEKYVRVMIRQLGKNE